MSWWRPKQVNKSKNISVPISVLESELESELKSEPKPVVESSEGAKLFIKRSHEYMNELMENTKKLIIEMNKYEKNPSYTSWNHIKLYTSNILSTRLSLDTLDRLWSHKVKNTNGFNKLIESKKTLYKSIKDILDRCEDLIKGDIFGRNINNHIFPKLKPSASTITTPGLVINPLQNTQIATTIAAPSLPIQPALSGGGSSPIEVNEMLETIIEKAKALGMSPKDYMTSPNGLNVPESEAPRLYDSLECLELINSNNGQNNENGKNNQTLINALSNGPEGMFGSAPKGGRKRYKKQTYKKRKGNKRTRRR